MMHFWLGEKQQSGNTQAQDIGVRTVRGNAFQAEGAAITRVVALQHGQSG